MYNYAIEALVAERQRAFMQAAGDHRLLANRGPKPRVRRAHRLARWLWEAMHQPRTFRRRPSVVAPPSVTVGS
jgi:hypothetical protein